MSKVHRTRRRAVAYYRCSTLQQEASIEEQRRWCRAAAEREGIDIVAEFEDEGVSGSEMQRRPGLMRMAAYCEDGKDPPAVLLCWDADRLSRASSTRTAALLDRLMEAGVTHILTAEGWVDLEDENDLLVFNIRQDTGRAAYARSIAKNVTRGAIERARAGQWVAGKPPYGYRVGEDGRLAVHEAEAAVVRGVFARVIAGDSLGDICRDLNARAASPPSARRRAAGYAANWRRDTLHKIIANRAYAGDLVWNKTHQGKHQRVKGGRQEKATGQKGRRVSQKNADADLVVFEHAHPALVSREAMAEAAAALRGRRWKRTAPTASHEWVFSGVLRCGDCQAKMYGRTERHRRGTGYVYRRYFCPSNSRGGRGTCANNGVLQDKVLAAVLAELRAIYADPGRLERLEGEVTARAAGDGASHAAEAERLAAEVRALDAQIAQGEQRLLVIPEQHIAGASRQLDAVKARRDEAAAALAALTASAERCQADARLVREALAALAGIEDDVADLPPREARRVVERLVSKVTVVFDPTRPANQGRASHIDIEFHPDVRNLLPSSARRQHLPPPLVVRVRLV